MTEDNLCARCKLISKRHNYMGGVGLCVGCDLRVGDEALEVRKLIEINVFI